MKRKLPVLNPEVERPSGDGDPPAKTSSRERPPREPRPNERAPRLSTSDDKPTFERARWKLGGPIGTAALLPGYPAGTLVEVLAGDSPCLGIVLHANVEEVLVLIDGERVRRTEPSLVRPTREPMPAILAGLAIDARIFGWLSEGQEVCFTRRPKVAVEAANQEMVERGKLIAKCRYGGLVAKGDGKMLAVGFRNLCPATPPRGAFNA